MIEAQDLVGLDNDSLLQSWKGAVIGCLLVLLSLAESSRLLFAYVDGESGVGFDAVETFTFSVFATLFVGETLIALGGHSESELLRRESLCVVGLGWIICTLFGALPIFLCGSLVVVWCESLSLVPS